MPSERRLHPATLLFDLARHLRQFALPAILVAFGASGAGEFGPERYLPEGSRAWQLWFPLLLVPAAAVSVVRYLSFRVRLDDHELVVRSGFIFRKVRHIPYSRIQNVDGIENPLHRLLGVMEVRVETGGGADEEARLSVLRREALQEIRERVFAGRMVPASSVTGDDGPAVETPTDSTLVQLSWRDLLLHGIVDNRGLILVGAVFGGLWETGLVNRTLGWAFGGDSVGRAVARDVVEAVFDDGPMPWGALGIATLAFGVFLLVARLMSTLWAFATLFDFRLQRIGEDLRSGYGLVTRVTATVPIRRVQAIIIADGPLHRLFERTSVRVETAGGRANDEEGRRAAPAREWLAPLVRQSDLPQLLRHVLPGVDIDSVVWEPAHARAFRRAVKPPLAIAGIVGLTLLPWSGAKGILLLLLVAGWVVVATRLSVRHLGWAVTDEVVLMRRGWLWREVTVTRLNKVQVVALRESPFDRRHVMATVHVDTAGAGEMSARVVPYLDRAVASGLADRIASGAASTAFRW